MKPATNIHPVSNDQPVCTEFDRVWSIQLSQWVASFFNQLIVRVLDIRATLQK